MLAAGVDIAGQIVEEGMVEAAAGEDPLELAELTHVASHVIGTLGAQQIGGEDVVRDGRLVLADEQEIAALLNPVYDIHRLGIFFTASPRHADVLLVTGAGAHGMAGPVRRTYDGMPDPKIVIAVGTDACGGGLLAGSYATSDGVGAVIPVDVWLPGSPPPPFSILYALLSALGRLADGGKR